MTKEMPEKGNPERLMAYRAQDVGLNDVEKATGIILDSEERQLSARSSSTLFMKLLL